MKARIILVVAFCFTIFQGYAQKGKNGQVTISSTNTQVNAYTTLTANASAGDTRIKVANNTLTTNFSDPLQTGDLIFIYQTQGATILGQLSGPDGIPGDSTWGSVTNYNNCGNYELVEVIKSNSADSIGLACPLQHDYTAAGKTQVIRVPRYSSLTVTGSGSVTCPAWNGSTGGVVVIEADGQLSLDGSIDVSAKGFRGGSLIGDNVTQYWPGYASTNNLLGAEKGEGIAGYQSDYTQYGGKYARGAAANGGGGGNAHNGGGGGGGNAGDVSSWRGYGTPDPQYNAAWALENPTMVNAVSAGGGQGGYTFSSNNCNALVNGPHDICWGGDGRRPFGGRGGRPLDYSTGKIFLGGGGGAGDQNDNDGGDGGIGAGLVFIECYGTVTGNGSILANGQDGEDTDPSNPPFNNYAGKDGAGGGGAGGTILFNSRGTIPNTISIQAKGGNGGDQLFQAWPFVNVSETEGPGGGGGGGYVALSNQGPSVSVAGGVAGVTQSPQLSEFPPNGATTGSAGAGSQTLENWYLQVDNQVVCPGNSVTFTASVVGNLPGNSEIVWYDAEVGGNIVNTGLTFTTPVINQSQVYYLGTCPGHYRVPAIAFVSVDYTLLSNVYLCSGQNAEIFGEQQTEPGTYFDTLQSSLGCDSILQQELVVGNVDTSVSENVNVLTANASGAGYQWLNCDPWQIISGENNQSYTAINSGYYAVEVAQNGCKDTSGCHFILITDVMTELADEISLYPNPVTNDLKVNLGSLYDRVELEVYSITGQRVMEPLVARYTSIVNINVEDLADGIYFMRLRVDKEVIVLKFRKL